MTWRGGFSTSTKYKVTVNDKEMHLMRCPRVAAIRERARERENDCDVFQREKIENDPSKLLRWKSCREMGWENIILCG